MKQSPNYRRKEGPCFTRRVGQYISLRGNDAIPVTVTINGTDHIGDLEAWRTNEAGDWEGYIKYAGPDPRGFTGIFAGWFPAHDIKRDEQPDGDPRGHEADAPGPAPQPPHPADEAAPTPPGRDAAPTTPARG